MLNPMISPIIWPSFAHTTYTFTKSHNTRQAFVRFSGDQHQDRAPKRRSRIKLHSVAWMQSLSVDLVSSKWQHFSTLTQEAI